MLAPLCLLFFSFNIYAIHGIDSETEREPIRPIPDIKIDKPAEVELGKKLFHDPKLSKNKTISCATCHPLSNAGVDSLPIAIGINGKKGVRNTPTVYNSSLHFRQFWDGRVETLEEQSKIPLLNPVEMGNTWSDIIKTLSNDPWYQTQFKNIYSDGITQDNIAKAIAQFERTLLTPNSPFDQYLKGYDNAINEVTLQGYKLFKSYGCSSCHQGVLVGGNMFEKLGVVIDYYSNTPGDNDQGRYEQTGIEEHRHEFKIPSLRNVELTAPDFHNGSVKTLEEVVYIMGRHQLGRNIPKEDVDKIVLFLKSLTALPRVTVK